MKQNISYKELKNKGFTLVEIVVIIAIMIVLLAILTPSILRYVENSRMQKDDSAMDEVCHGVLLALSDSEIFDEAVSYAIPNNYVTYTDSSGVYAAKYVDEEFWAPDGSGNAVTITFNPDENGTYVLANGLVNDMTYGNGSVADTRTADGLKQCYFSEMGQQKLYHKVAQTIGETFSEKSATYKNSSYTVFITFDVVNGIKRADVYGEWNGTNLDENCPASLGSGTNSYTEDEEPEQTKTGGTTQSNYTSSDLTGTGGTSGCPSYKPCAHPTWILKDADNEFHQCETCLKEETHEFKNLSCIKCGFTKPHRCETFVDGICPECGLNKPIAFEITHTNYHMAGIVREGHVVIPDRFVYEGVQYEVTGIGKIAFDNCPELLSVYIPDTVTYIEYPRSSGEHWGGAFSNCPKLESVRMSPNIKGTLRGTFYQCKSLKSMVIPDGVTSLYWYTFSGCRSLESLTLGKSVKSMQSDVVSGTKIKTINIPSTMRTLFGYALTGAPFDYITYDGTTEQWHAIQKGSPYIYIHVPVICTDGTTCTLPKGGTATCQNKAVCTECNQEYGLPLAHAGGVATCQNKAICTSCNQEYGELLPCSGGTATCLNKAICSMCKQEYGNFGPHDMTNGTCMRCGEQILIAETPHKYANNQNYVILGKWDYSDAKSVDITIEYETESTSWDWVSIVEGNDYIAGNSYNQTKNYLNTSGNIVSTTGTNSSVKFGGKTRTTKTFTNVDMLQGTVVFRSDGSSTYWGAKVTITPNY